MVISESHISPSVSEVQIKKIWSILESVSDPEVPVLSIVDLGMVRAVERISDGDNFAVEIVITPTYSGCPAMDTIAMNTRFALIANGFDNFKITTKLSPAWTTDWMTEDGKLKLKNYGIAAPVGKSLDSVFIESLTISCPQCNSTNTKVLSEFGSTSCKALMQCNDCREPFDYFKCH